MNIGIIGGGSIGLLTAAYLGRNHVVNLYVRREKQKQEIDKEGIHCSTLPHPTAVDTRLTSEGLEEHDVLIIAVKQHQVSSLLHADFPPETPLLFLQNGMGHLEQLPESHECWLGVVEHGALKRSDSSIEHLGQGNIQLACFRSEDNGHHMAASLHSEDFPFIYREDYESMMTGKLLVNTVINPLTALFGVKNGEIVQNTYINKLASTLCEEACRVLDMSYQDEWNRVQSVAKNTKDNESSMLKDVKAGRETEIDAICGYIVNKSSADVPYHQFVLDAIHALEERGGA
ncbi:2-dehydropantoate 2-reductase [Halobacillus locisalis]|uniref:2-dehydropantoate 2-reductase n=1 Tax=Halobacillus locisalis TaxID=220753 RepID=A0A838CRN1_9BACI|nr:2-dehydropantoate 2-reductase [Halobacillus locisalis]MBA2174276.1 2-dehydropantoate 2-reductase [Halobacillus locisalis]